MVMNSYAKGSEPINLLREAINISADGEVFHHKMMLLCQSMGFQGAKRLNRCKSKEDRCHYIELQNYTLDMFGEIIEPSWNYEPVAVKSYKEYLEAYLNWEISVYERVNKISNSLIVAEFKEEASLVASCLKGVRKEIEKCRRWLQEGYNTNWDMSYLLLKDHELHEKMKEIE